MKDIPGYEGVYAVTDDGRVWSYPKNVVVGRNGGVRKDNGKWLVQSRVRIKYAHLRVYLSRDGKKTPHLVHRLVAQAFIPSIAGKLHVNHIDGNPANNHFSNLEWCTPKENARHAVDMGLTLPPNQRGAKNSNATLSESTVRAIRARYEILKNASAVAREFGIRPRHANDVIRNVLWAHVS